MKGKRKINLVELAVNPDQVEWDQDSIRIDSYELYTNSGDSSNDEEILSYTLQQVPGEQEWWIESSSYSFDYFKDSIRAPYLKKATAQ